VLDGVDVDALLATLAELVEIESLSGHESPAQTYVADFLRAAGLAVEVWPLDLDALARHPYFSMEVERTEALGVLGSLGGGGDGGTLLLNGHVDVVPAGDPAGWTVDPWRLTVRGIGAGELVEER
jgi:acetylornithine deacetylase